MVANCTASGVVTHFRQNRPVYQVRMPHAGPVMHSEQNVVLEETLPLRSQAFTLLVWEGLYVGGVQSAHEEHIFQDG